MNEQFLSFLWKFRLYSTPLYTTQGVAVTVIQPGEQHHNAGPDFFNARVRIGETLWAGNVELHVRSSDWYRHRHQTDKAYNTVILHVVYEADTEIVTGDMTVIPTVALAEQADVGILRMYARWRASGKRIPCSGMVNRIAPVVLQGWIDRMLTERLESKSLQIARVLEHNRGDWEDTYYQLLAKNFGFSVNAVPFEMLARMMPLQVMRKHQDDLFALEALYFGQAGLLTSDLTDPYPVALRTAYRFLANKYRLVALEPHLWKRLRMRPANFPTVRIAQFAAWMHSGNLKFDSLLRVASLRDFTGQLRMPASPYWNHHFLFDRPTRYHENQPDSDSIRNVIINTCAPILFYYGKSHGLETYVTRSFAWLQALPAETNHILHAWKRAGLEADNAYTGQALLGLHRNYCSLKKCLNCSLGLHLLRNHHA